MEEHSKDDSGFSSVPRAKLSRSPTNMTSDSGSTSSSDLDSAAPGIVPIPNLGEISCVDDFSAPGRLGAEENGEWYRMTQTGPESRMKGTREEGSEATVPPVPKVRTAPRRSRRLQGQDAMTNFEIEATPRPVGNEVNEEGGRADLEGGNMVSGEGNQDINQSRKADRDVGEGANAYRTRFSKTGKVGRVRSSSRTADGAAEAPNIMGRARVLASAGQTGNGRRVHFDIDFNDDGRDKLPEDAFSLPRKRPKNCRSARGVVMRIDLEDGIEDQEDRYGERSRSSAIQQGQSCNEMVNENENEMVFPRRSKRVRRGGKSG